MGLFKSQWDLQHFIATHNPDILVLKQTKLTESHKPQPGWNTSWKVSKGGLPTWAGSTASLQILASMHALGITVYTPVLSRQWPDVFPPEQEKPADLLM